MSFNIYKAAKGLVVPLVLAAGLLAANAVQAADRHVVIINDTQHTMIRFYASNIEAKSWEEDILGREVVAPGSDVNINVDDGTGHCLFDFKAVFDNGQELIKHNVNVCKISDFHYTE